VDGNQFQKQNTATGFVKSGKKAKQGSGCHQLEPNGSA